MFNTLSKRVREVVVYGDIANQLINDNEQKFPIMKFSTLSQAFEYATKKANPSDTILLSPATASYDQYKNYIERGKDFDNLVKEYENSTKKV